MRGVKCPQCKSRFFVSGNVPKWTVCDSCGIQFVVEHNRTKIRDFIEKITGKWGD